MGAGLTNGQERLGPPITVGDITYTLYGPALTFQAAEVACRDLVGGGHLASTISQSEWTALLGLLPVSSWCVFTSSVVFRVVSWWCQ